MKPRSYGSEGVVLGRKNFGEADRIIFLYTKSYGKLVLLAKGIRRPKSKKRGHLEIFSVIKFQAMSGHGFDMVTEAETIEDYNGLRKKLSKVSLAYYFMEVIGKITHEGEANVAIYNLITNSLNDLRDRSDLKTLRIEFITNLLIIMGYWSYDKKLIDADAVLSEVVEKKISSTRVGKRVLEN